MLLPIFKHFGESSKFDVLKIFKKTIFGLKLGSQKIMLEKDQGNKSF